MGDNYILKYDLSNVQALQADINEKLDAAQKLFNLGLPMTIINKRLELGFEESDLSSEAFLPMSYTPIDAIGEDDDEEIVDDAKSAYGK